MRATGDYRPGCSHALRPCACLHEYDFKVLAGVLTLLVMDRLDFRTGFNCRILLAALVLCFSTALAVAQNRSRSLDDYFGEASQLEKQQDFAGAEKVYRAAAQDYPNQRRFRRGSASSAKPS